jgi:hypothetical protein
MPIRNFKASKKLENAGPDPKSLGDFSGVLRAADPFKPKGSRHDLYFKDQFASNAPGSEAVKLAHDWLLGFWMTPAAPR